MVEEGLKYKRKKIKIAFLKDLVNFLKYRVNVDIQDNEGRTVIHKAVIANDIAVVEKLLTKKANLKSKRYTWKNSSSSHTMERKFPNCKMVNCSWS